MIHEERAAGASASLNKTITELMEYMESTEARPNADFRKFMYEKIGDIAEWWAQEGFYWGHGMACWQLARQDEVPATLTMDYGDAQLAPGCERELVLRSRIRRDAWRNWNGP
jgi:hypothetical protein